MKKNSSLWLIFFSILPGLLMAQTNLLEFGLSSGRSSRETDSNFLYQMQPFAESQLQIKAQNHSEKRLNFSQNSRQSLLGLDFALQRGWLLHGLTSGFDYLQDSSQLEADLNPYRSKTGYLGYWLEFSPLDSLSFELGAKGLIRSEEDRYIQDAKLNSDGWQGHARAQASMELWNSWTGVNLSYERKKMDWESQQNAGLNLFFNHHSPKLVINNNFSLGSQEDDIYELLSGDGGRGFYEFKDSQKRGNLTYNAILEYLPWAFLTLELQESFGKRNVELSQSTARNSSDLNNQSSLSLKLEPINSLAWENSFAHYYGLKRFSSGQNTRHSENRTLNSILKWEYIDGDTLSAGFNLDLQRNTFPDDGNRWDNDLRHTRLSLGNAHYWKDRLKLGVHAFWNLTDDVYLDSLLSANCKQTSTYVLTPEIALLVGDRLLFNQHYQVRADYTQYRFGTAPQTFYRQLEVEYKLVFDSFPYAARSQDRRWLLLPYRSGDGSAFVADLSFGFEHNEYADFDQDAYAINFKNDRYTAGLSFKHDINSLYYIIQPRYSWGTWTEYGVLFGLAWQFNESSLLEFSLNPVGSNLNDLDWRCSVSLGAHF